MWNDETKFLRNFNIAPLAHLILTGISDLDLLLAHRMRLLPGTEGTYQALESDFLLGLGRLREKDEQVKLRSQ